MKLLLDENLSQRLVALIDDLYPESRHVEDCGLASASDDEVWLFAAERGFDIVSKDSDFAERSALQGSPPKVIWLRTGNCTSDLALGALRSAFPQILAFLTSKAESCLVLSLAVRKPAQDANQ